MKEERSKIGFYSKGVKIQEIGLFQSPRGIRNGDHRPDIVVIDCHVICDNVQLGKLIRYLSDVHCALELKKEEWNGTKTSSHS
jgi:hypothetical protein